MDKPAWSKSPPELVAIFEAVFPGPPAVARPMFGFPAAFVNGNLFMSLHQDHLVLRLPEGPAQELLEILGGERFEPVPGRAMTGYYTVPASMTAGANDVAALEPWVTRAFEHAAALPPKVSRPRAGTKNPKAKEGPAHP
jgi:hypothetical protein